MKRYNILTLVLFVIMILAFVGCHKSHDGHDHDEHKHDEYKHDEHKHGEDEKYMADVELSETAVEIYDIRTRKISSGKPVALPRAAVVAFKDEYFAYVKSGDYFHEIEIRPTKVEKEFVSLGSLSLHDGEEIVVSGAAYLRIVFLNNKNPSHGHSH